MAKRVFKYSDFAEMMEKYNPFALKNEKSEIMMFENYRKVYEYTLKRLYEKYPRGYIDLVLFVHEECGIPFADAEREVKGWRKYCANSVTLVEWKKADMARNNELRNILFSLHLITETSFNEVEFKQSLVYLDTLISSENERKAIDSKTMDVVG